jgi:hypothetical protein
MTTPNDDQAKPDSTEAPSVEGVGLGARNCWAFAREERKRRFDDAVAALDRYGVPEEEIVSALEVLADLVDDEAHGREQRGVGLVANAGASAVACNAITLDLEIAKKWVNFRMGVAEAKDLASRILWAADKAGRSFKPNIKRSCP